MTIDRYHRQILLPQIGQSGQDRLHASRVLLVGCGALGSNIAEQLARAGVGHLRIADRDIVELTNLQRQVLFDESDSKEGLPKAAAAAQRIGRINSSIAVEPRVIDVDSGNIESLVEGADLIIDGTDNIATRYLLNDVSIKLGKPWIYGACVGTEGRVMTIVPGQTACLRCVFPKPPDASEIATCDTAGVLGPVAAVVASMQSLAAIKLLSGCASAVAAELLTFDLWRNRIHSVSLADARRPDCPTCAMKQFEFLNRPADDANGKLCGRNAIQIRPTMGTLSLNIAVNRLRAAGAVQSLPFMVRCALSEEGLSLSVFEDGRVIVQGTTDVGRARAVVARYLGS